MDDDQKATIKALIEAEKDRRVNSKAVMSEVLYQKHERYVYNIKLENPEPRLKLFVGEAGKLVQTRFN